MNWMDDFIENTLEKVPEGRYHKRAEAELRDHLETQCRTLTEAGRAAEEAQTEALRLMGEPEKLQGEYEAAWRSTLEGRLNGLGQRLGVIARGCFLMGALYIFTSMLLGMAGFTYDAWIPGRVCFPILSGNKLYVTVYSTVLFLFPFTLGAWFLRFCFRRERHPVGLVTAGLLAAWIGERAAIILISALIYQMPLGLDLLTRIYHGGDTTAPWFSPVNYVLTFAGCLLLGQLFGRLGGKKPQTA